MKKTEEEKKAYFKEYRKNHLEKCRAGSRRWNREHKNACREANRRFLKRHPHYYTYVYHKASRKKNVVKHNEYRARYYTKHRYNSDLKRRWTEVAEDLLFSYPGTDVMLAKYIHRSAGAVQVKRCVMNRKRRKGVGSKES